MCSMFSCSHQRTKRRGRLEFRIFMAALMFYFSETDKEDNDKHHPSLPKQGKLHPFPRVIYSVMVVLLCWWLCWERGGTKKVKLELQRGQNPPGRWENLHLITLFGGSIWLLQRPLCYQASWDPLLHRITPLLPSSEASLLSISQRQ